MPRRIVRTTSEPLRAGLEAMAFAAERHAGQEKRGERSLPKVNHVIDVAALLASAGVDDPVTLVAAILHDTIENTATTPEEIGAAYGKRVRDLVLEVTDDPTLSKKERRRMQVEHAADLSVKAKRIKIADKISNIHDLTDDPPEKWSKRKRREYVDWAAEVVEGCRGVGPEALEQAWDQALEAARARFDA